uniref:probable receptor-like protein kinase At1g30570 n=1 Tax=Erigeron canadensis TaxID=72917 RepID=UPI001CB9CD7D|nr:probable receptor-like protein kinase At1g30570 [Erigeron canadensis]
MDFPTQQLCHHFSLADIQLATQNFNDGMAVGQGGFGKVYKGYIQTQKSSNSIVAIKRLDSMSDQGAPEFKAEVEMLSRLRHSHLVSLLGCCVDGEEMILVYEYMPHETLYHHLHKTNTPLTWMQRLKISIGAARGLDYLHTGTGTNHGVIHRDVKSSNILLDEYWEAKISDFGLATICPINQSSTYVNAVIKGTFGYLDPEIFMTGKFTRKTDVFAFGVVLFELLSGRHAVLPDGDEDLSLATWAKKCVRKGKLDQVVSAEIKEQLFPKSLKEFSQIAYRCLHTDPKERPTMSEVVLALQQTESLQLKFLNDSIKPAGVFGFAWKMPSYFALPTKDISGHTDTNPTRNSKNNNRYNPVLPKIEQIHSHDIKIFSYTDLKRATRNFQNASRCRWGLVFLGWVHEKTYSPSEKGVGLAITVMHFLEKPEGNLKLLSEFSHPNLHRVLGYCLEDGRFYLVHEFLEERSLRDHLYEGDAAELPFTMRVKIVIGVARALVFLKRKRLIVKNWMLNTHEIWFDEDFNAKLLYFDGAKLVIQMPRPLAVAWSPWVRQCDSEGIALLLMEILIAQPVITSMDFGKLHFYRLSHVLKDMSDKKIKNLVDPRMKLRASQIKRVRELISLIYKIYESPYNLEDALLELEQFYFRMT